MRLLLDTHLLLWALGDSPKLSQQARDLIEEPDNVLVFSVASLWEITIKRGLGRDDFEVDPRLARRTLLDNGYEELTITAEHVLAVEELPSLHRDPFDRLLVAQGTVEGATLITADDLVAEYGGAVRRV